MAKPQQTLSMALNSPDIGHGAGPANLVYSDELATSKGILAAQQTLTKAQNSPGTGRGANPMGLHFASG